MEKIREKVIARIHAGDKPMDISRNFGIARSTIYSIKKLYDESGGYVRRTGNCGRPKSVRTADLVGKIKKQVKDQPNNSVRGLAKKNDITESTMRNLVRFDLGMRSRAVVPVQMLTVIQREKRLERSKKILNWLKIFSDEKNFVVDKYNNRRNDRYIAKSAADTDASVKYVPRSKHPAKAMMLGVVGSDGKTIPPIWIKGNLNASMYKHILAHQVFPALDATYGQGNWVWTQDGAPSHTSDAVQKYIISKLSSKGFWSKEMWPPSSPNLNPLDYFVWTHVEQRACATSHPNVDALKASVNKVWAAMNTNDIVNACKAFRSRIEACIKAEGSIFEK
ncbi:Transposable element tcb2 transposase [Caligus rogercresseyi]|uniref:Transposable element tcb2 transposase n=1 Tax=Caligus rogercresseyi TaxID=217165 RepID=A0A7T8HHM8_CALRO|nr:Transposable element tcb2 transposase [Caligus rogercresseyi]